MRRGSSASDPRQAVLFGDTERRTLAPTQTNGQPARPVPVAADAAPAGGAADVAPDLAPDLAPDGAAAGQARRGGAADQGLVPRERREPLSASDLLSSRGDREICLGPHRVPYVLRRVRRRSIGFIVGETGLTVNAPGWVPLREVEAALRAKTGWILRKLHEQQDRARCRLQARIDWRDGAVIPFLGQNVVVVLDAQAGGVPGGAVLEGGAAGAGGAAPRALRVALGPDAAASPLREAVRSWLQREARRVFEDRCALYAERLGVRVTRLTLSSARTRWGSASATGAIRLNWRLIHFSLPTIDYVVAHELAHLREMNHSPKFWDVVRSVVPDYERARSSLRSEPLPPFD